jgi:alpha-D-ribose 1-methylphosphonate 5-triphosphate synthase subunit PhnI
MSPREKFRQDRSLTRGYNDLIGGTQMQAALDTTSREHDSSLAPAHDVTTAAANRWRKEGADSFRRILENLNTSTVTTTPPTPGQLDHKA